MPGLNDLLSVDIVSRIRGAYREEDQFYVDGLPTPVGLLELLQYILDNLGGDGGGPDRYVNNAALTPSNVLVLTLSTGQTIEVDLSDLVGVGRLLIYNAGQNFWIKGTAGIVVTNPSQGTYNVNIPAGGILESLQKEFTNAGGEYTVGGEVVLVCNWNTGAFNTNFANSVLPVIDLVDGAGTQRAPNGVAVTVQHTAVSGGTTNTIIANINGLGTPVRVKATF